MSVRNFDFSEPAELFSGSKWGGRPPAITYQRFDAAAEAIRYVVEELSDVSQRACVLEVDESRFSHKEIRKLYNSRNYPLPRRLGKEKDGS